MNLLPAFQALMAIAIAIATGLAVLGQVRWRATQEWEQLAEARLQRIETLEAELTRLKERVKQLEDENAALQRLVLRLQRRLGNEGGGGTE